MLNQLLIAASREIAVQSCPIEDRDVLLETASTILTPITEAFDLGFEICLGDKRWQEGLERAGERALSRAASSQFRCEGGLTLSSSDPGISDRLLEDTSRTLCRILSSHLERIDRARALEEAREAGERARRELQHRHRNALQLYQNVLSLIASEGEELPPCERSESMIRRIGAVIAVCNLWSQGRERIPILTCFECLQAELGYATGGRCLAEFESEENPALNVDQAIAIGVIASELAIATTRGEGPSRSRIRLSVTGSNLSLCCEGTELEGGQTLIDILIARAKGKRLDGREGSFEAVFSIAETGAD